MKKATVYTMFWAGNPDEVELQTFHGWEFEHDNRVWQIYAVNFPVGKKTWIVDVIDPYTGLSINSERVTGFEYADQAAAAVYEDIKNGYGQYKFNRFNKIINDDPDTYETVKEMFRSLKGDI